MGTNFYIIEEKSALDNSEFESHGNHIGKRSAAGNYCYDCGVSLCKGGDGAVHMSKDRHGRETEWFDECPVCGSSKNPDAKNNAAMIELGFEKTATQGRKGVQSCSSFTWATLPKDFYDFCKDYKDKEVIIDEYERLFTCSEFLEMLKNNCPIQYFESIGSEFS